MNSLHRTGRWFDIIPSIKCRCPHVLSRWGLLPYFLYVLSTKFHYPFITFRTSTLGRKWLNMLCKFMYLRRVAYVERGSSAWQLLVWVWAGQSDWSPGSATSCGLGIVTVTPGLSPFVGRAEMTTRLM